MPTPIYPEALKAYRTRKHWTQEQLADATRGPYKVSLPTIKRIESAKDNTYLANDRVAKGLAKALGISVEDLAKGPSETGDHEESLRKSGYRPLRTMIDAEAALAFNMVQHLYGVSVRSQIEMAPLFATLLAEGSLAWRRKRVDSIEEAADRLMSLGGGHFSFAHAAYRAQDGAADERASIEKRDLFGEHVGNDTFDLGFDPSVNNPFADYLQVFASEAEAKTVTFMKDFGWKTSEGLPAYRIGADIIEQLTAGDPDAEYALLRGHARLKDIPEELRSDDKEVERVAWMIARIPDEELTVRKAERADLMERIGSIDLGDMASVQDRPQGDDHG